MHRTSSPMLTLCSSLGQMGPTQPRQEQGAGPVQHGPHTSAWLQMAAQITGICMTFGGNTDNSTSLSFSRAMGRHTHGPLQQYRPSVTKAPGDRAGHSHHPAPHHCLSPVPTVSIAQQPLCASLSRFSLPHTCPRSVEPTWPAEHGFQPDLWPLAVFCPLKWKFQFRGA